MASIKINIVVNLASKILAAGITIVLIPYYIRYLGIESYGLVGFYSTLIGSMAILDLGLSITLSRELAKQKADGRPAKDIRDLTFSLECIYWGVAIVLGLLVVLTSGLIASKWVNAENLPPAVVKQAIMLMGLIVAFQWPVSLYDGGLRGLDEQIFSNVVAIIMTVLRGVGVLVILNFVSATLEAFFIWQAVIALLYVVVTRWGLWKRMPKDPKRLQFSTRQVKAVGRFALGMTGISAVTFFITQIDKIVLSKILLLSQFAYYTLAFTIATSITLIVGPVSAAFFPRFTTLAAAQNQDELKLIYHKACRLMATFIFPVSFVLIFFIRDILLIWTKSAETTNNTSLMAQVLIVGSMFNSLMVLPYYLIIASGHIKFSFRQNLIAAIILVPLLFIWTHFYGALGATFVWLSVNAGYIFISQPLMHRRLLKRELANWYWFDTFLPMLPPLATVAIIKLALIYWMPDLHINLLVIIGIMMITFIASLLFLPDARVVIKKTFKKLQLNGQRA